MQAAILDPVRTEPAVSFPIDLPSDTDVLYPDFGSALSPVPSDPTDAPDTVAQAFIVDSLARADWCVSRILDAEARIARWAALASELHTRIDAWLTKASAADNDSISYLSSLLRPFVETEVSMQRRSRSLVLPSGVAQLRKLPDKLDITSSEAAMAWATENAPNAIIVKKELSRSVLKSLIVSKGEAVPGCEFSLGPDELYVRASA